MSEVIPRSSEIRLARLSILLWVFFFTLTALGVSIVGVSYTMRWREVDWQDRIIAGLLILIQWGNVMMALFNKAASRLSKGEFPIENGDSHLIRKTQVATLTESEVKKNP